MNKLNLNRIWRLEITKFRFRLKKIRFSLFNKILSFKSFNRIGIENYLKKLDLQKFEVFEKILPTYLHKSKTLNANLLEIFGDQKQRNQTYR